MDKNTLKKYLKRALELEKNKMELEQTLSKIDRKYSAEIKEMNTTEIKPKYTATGHSVWIGALISFLFAAFVLGDGLGVEYSDELAIFIIIFGGVVGFGINWFWVQEKNNKEIAEKKAVLASENAERKLQNERNTISTNKKNKMISSSVNKIKSAITNTQTELDILYASNFIYPKYRNIIAVASMYEYIDSGRCNSLEGADGAYNIFELEVRLDRIITRLDVIISKLDQIRANQYYLYTAIKEIQPHIDKVSNTIIENTNKLNEVAVNTAVTAYTAQVIERNQYYGRNWSDGRGVYNDRVNMPRI